jgi:D-glycero-alpha-D-manno-heptose-7-phosphate kinase
VIISRTPLRMSFVGGGSDLPSYYRRHGGGAVVSTAINKYVYITVNEKFDDSIRVSYSKTEEVSSVADIQHKLMRETMFYLGIKGGVEITSIADIPSRGTGLGSSSAFTVGLLNALHAHRRHFVAADTLAQEACYIEIDICGEPIGKQDQYASAFGGLNFMQFNEDDTVFTNPIICQTETLQRLQENIIVFYTGIARNASSILQAQGENLKADPHKRDAMRRMVHLAFDMRAALQRNNLDDFGDALHENWLLKKSMAGNVSSDQIDHWYERGRKAGALGGKLLGAGNGGFLMFYAPSERHETIVSALENLRKVEFGCEPEGSKIIFVHKPG